MKKILLLAALTCASSFSAFADNLEAKFEGMFVFEGAARNQKRVPKDNNLTNSYKHSSINSLAYFSGLVSHETDSMKYGARLVLTTTALGTASSGYEGSHIFAITDLGKIELGSGFDAGTQMRITALDVARGSGDNWTDYAYFVPNVAMIATPSFFLSGYHKDGNIETSRKITYFTPKMAGVRFGVSYIPDTGNVGSNIPSNTDVPTAKARVVDVNATTRYVEPQSAKNAVSLGASYEHDLSEGVDLKLAATGEFGKTTKRGSVGAPDPSDKNTVLSEGSSQYKLTNMRTYNLGAVLTHGNFAYAGSYGEARGFTSQQVDGNRKRTRFYTAAASYTQGPVGVSLAYALGETKKNRVNSITLGTDYKLAPGLMPYAEFTYFKGKGSKLPVFNDPTKYPVKGTIALIGMKLKF